MHFSGPLLLFPAQKFSGTVISAVPEERHRTAAAARGAAAGRCKGNPASLRSIFTLVPLLQASGRTVKHTACRLTSLQRQRWEMPKQIWLNHASAPNSGLLLFTVTCLIIVKRVSGEFKLNLIKPSLVPVIKALFRGSTKGGANWRDSQSALTGQRRLSVPHDWVL